MKDDKGERVSIMRCEKHDTPFDTDKRLECPRCEDELQHLVCPVCLLSLHTSDLFDGMVDHYFGDGSCPLHGKQFDGKLMAGWQPKRRPNPETQAVATVRRDGGAFRLDWYGEFKNLQDGEKLYRSPVEAVPVSALRELEAAWRELADIGSASPEKMGPRQQAATRVYARCADRLSAVIRGTKT